MAIDSIKTEWLGVKTLYLNVNQIQLESTANKYKIGFYYKKKRNEFF